jgi:large-conductance mechanosensitive channel
MSNTEKKEEPKTRAAIIATGEGAKVVTSKHSKHHRVTGLLEPDDLVREQVGGFERFLREYAVVGLAAGFIIGQQANGVAKQMVDSFVQPWLQVLFGTNLGKRAAIVHHGQTPITVAWGAFLYALIEFFFVVLFIYLVIKLFRLDKFRIKS